MSDTYFQLKLNDFDIIKANTGIRLRKVWGAKFPSELMVLSHISGRNVKFVPIPPEHPEFDQDQWDGEQMVYYTKESGVNVKTLVLYHG